MLTVSASLSQAFVSQLCLRNIPDQQRRDCHKWLRFYLDFCAKYASDPKLTASFAGFDEKLKIKGQSDAQRKEARRSIAIYYRMIGTLQSPPAPSGNLTAKNANNPLPSTSSGTPNPDSSSQVVPFTASKATLAFGIPVKILRFFSLTTRSWLSQATILNYCPVFGVHFKPFKAAAFWILKAMEKRWMLAN